MSGKLHEKKKREKQKRMLTENMFWVEAKAEAAPKEKKLEKTETNEKQQNPFYIVMECVL